jgi:adenosine deaminase
LLDERLKATIRAMPKIELHRHLEGSVRLSTLVDIANQSGIEMPEYDIETLRPFVQMMPDETRNSQHFLNKFMMLRQFYRSEDIVARIAREVVIDAAQDNVRYMELRFTPKALCNITECPLEEIVPLVCNAANEAAAEHHIIVRHIISMNRHESVELGEHALRAAIDNQHLGVVGVDLAGDEANYDGLRFRPLFRRARAAGLGVTIHAGEWAGSDSVWNAIGNLGAQRVGHGIHVLDDPAMVQVLIDRNITLEVCPSSNILSGVVDKMTGHPLTELNRRNVLTTLNTDDPLICNITLTDEIMRAVDEMGLTLDDIKQMMMRAAKAAFLPDNERTALVREFEGLLATV